MDGLSPFVAAIDGKHTLLKPPLSAGMRSGSVRLAPGEAVGEHKTDGREEAIVVISGVATIVCEGEAFEARARQFAYVPPECVHNVINNSATEALEYVYVVAAVGGLSGNGGVASGGGRNGMGEHLHGDGSGHFH